MVDDWPVAIIVRQVIYAGLMPVRRSNIGKLAYLSLSHRPGPVMVVPTGYDPTDGIAPSGREAPVSSPHGSGPPSTGRRSRAWPCRAQTTARRGGSESPAGGCPIHTCVRPHLQPWGIEARSVNDWYSTTWTSSATRSTGQSNASPIAGDSARGTVADVLAALERDGLTRTAAALPA